jgi:signal transduction histidine kinase
MSIITLLYNPSLALIALIITVIIGLFLAIAVLINNPRGATHQIFSALSIFTIVWLLVNYLTSSFAGFPFLLPYALFLHRLGIFIAAPLSLFFFLLGHTLPSDKIKLNKPVLYLSCLGTLLVMALNLSPFAFTDNVINGYSSTPVAGPGLIPFSVLSTLFSLLAIFFLFRTYCRSTGIVKAQARLVLFGILTMLALIILTVLIPIISFQSLFFLQFTPLYALIFLGATAYAVTKYQLFDIKVLLTQSITLVICAILFARIFGEPTTQAQVVDMFILLLMIIFGSFLVRSVQREVEQRQIIEKQKKQLEIANQGQTQLIHILNHQIKGYLAKGRTAFAEILEEPEYQPFNAEAKKMMEEGLRALTEGADFVEGVLNASSVEQGTITYNMTPFDFKKLVAEAAEKQKAAADEKGLKYEVVLPAEDMPAVGDFLQLKEAVRNLIDNSIKYTLTGSVSVSLKKTDTAYRMAVTDTGVGLTDEDKTRLFTQGGRGKDSLKYNTNSTGYGLSFVKGVVEAHQGHVWAESEGRGKGSVFFLELPIKRG